MLFITITTAKNCNNCNLQVYLLQDVLPKENIYRPDNQNLTKLSLVGLRVLQMGVSSDVRSYSIIIR